MFVYFLILEECIKSIGFALGIFVIKTQIIFIISSFLYCHHHFALSANANPISETEEWFRYEYFMTTLA